MEADERESRDKTGMRSKAGADTPLSVKTPGVRITLKASQFLFALQQRPICCEGGEQ
jgi:hypothetical protein